MRLVVVGVSEQVAAPWVVVGRPSTPWYQDLPLLAPPACAPLRSSLQLADRAHTSTR